MCICGRAAAEDGVLCCLTYAAALHLIGALALDNVLNALLLLVAALTVAVELS